MPRNKNICTPWVGQMSSPVLGFHLSTVSLSKLCQNVYASLHQWHLCWQIKDITKRIEEGTCYIKEHHVKAYRAHQKTGDSIAACRWWALSWCQRLECRLDLLINRFIQAFFPCFLWIHWRCQSGMRCPLVSSDCSGANFVVLCTMYSVNEWNESKGKGPVTRLALAWIVLNVTSHHTSEFWHCIDRKSVV